jgi:hypothetical protein
MNNSTRKCANCVDGQCLLTYPKKNCRFIAEAWMYIHRAEAFKDSMLKRKYIYAHKYYRLEENIILAKLHLNCSLLSKWPQSHVNTASYRRYIILHLDRLSNE